MTAEADKLATQLVKCRQQRHALAAAILKLLPLVERREIDEGEADALKAVRAAMIDAE